MEKARPWCGQPSDRGRLKNRTELLGDDGAVPIWRRYARTRSKRRVRRGPVVELGDPVLDGVVDVVGGRREHVDRQVSVDHHSVTTEPVARRVRAVAQLTNRRLAQLLLRPTATRC